jgi:hypothetical protein
MKGDLQLGYHLEMVFVTGRDASNAENHAIGQTRSMEDNPLAPFSKGESERVVPFSEGELKGVVPSSKGEYWQSVLGLDYSFWGKWILLGEYFYNGSGRAKRTDLTASDFSLLDEFKYRHYLYSQISYQHDIFLGASVFLLWNMADGSFILSPGMSYSLFQNTDLNLYSQIFFGDETDEYGPARLGGNQIYYLKLTIKF